MIKPVALWNFIHECEVEDAEYIGRICLALAGKEVNLTRPELIQLRTIIKDNEDMNERIEARRGHDRERQARRRESMKTPDVSSDSNGESEKEESSKNDALIETSALTEDFVLAEASLAGVPQEYARWWFSIMQGAGWRRTDGTTVSRDNCRAVLYAWWMRADEREKSMIRERKRNLEKNKPRKFTKKDWVLCSERCACFVDGKCSKGFKSPPQLRLDRPIPPQECECFMDMVNEDFPEDSGAVPQPEGSTEKENTK